jgi:acetylglutamate kinase
MTTASPEPLAGAPIRTATPQSDERARVAQGKAAVLREALPWITRFHGQTVVIKYGGNAMVEDGLKRSFAADIALLRFVGLRPVIVHGGGPQISALAEARGVASRFVGGLRVTDAPMLDVVRSALMDDVNPEMVALVTDAGATAVGISGERSGLIVTRPAVGPAGEDLGLVGEVAAIEVDALRDALEQGAVPVIATLGRDPDGTVRNVNADLAAGAIAAALGASKYVVLTDVAGLYEDFGDEEARTLITETTVEDLERMLADDELHDGMRPKVRSVVDAVRGGVPQAHLLDGRVLHAVLIEIFTDEGIGTMIDTGGATATGRAGSAA